MYLNGVFINLMYFSLDVNRDELIDEEHLFGGMTLTAKERADYKLVDSIFSVVVLNMSESAICCKFGLAMWTRYSLMFWSSSLLWLRFIGM